MYALSITTIKRYNGVLSRITTDYFLFQEYALALEAYTAELEKPYDAEIEIEIALVLLPDDLTDTKEPVTLRMVRDGTDNTNPDKES